MRKWDILCLILMFYLISSLHTVKASEAPITIVQNQLSAEALIVSFEVNADNVFTPQTLTFLQRGFTIRTDYTVELWRSRNIWFDKLEAQEQIRCELNYDIVSRSYKCIISRTDKIEPQKGNELSKAMEWVTKMDSLEILTRQKLDLNGQYYYTIKADVATLTAQDMRDLQRWLESDSGERKDGELSISRATFSIVTAFLSAKNHRKFSMESQKFRGGELANAYRMFKNLAQTVRYAVSKAIWLYGKVI
ncbi:DUF4390 domain-containing protein [Candidatus Poribacteria bacterium]|nr:DUF4390 domain-containing protein [Candidatus Poribacteria bacterium]